MTGKEAQSPNHLQPNGESIFLKVGVEKALLTGRCMSERHHLPEAIGIEDPLSSDYDLFSDFLTQRLLRTSIYSTSYILNSAIAVAAGSGLAGKIVGLLDKGDRFKRQILTRIEEETRRFIDQNYKTIEERHHARKIELAVNDLAARSTVEIGSQVGIVLDKHKIEEWRDYWRRQIRLSQIQLHS